MVQKPVHDHGFKTSLNHVNIPKMFGSLYQLVFQLCHGSTTATRGHTFLLLGATEITQANPLCVGQYCTHISVMKTFPMNTVQ